MEFLDIAVASAYAAICLSLILIVNPIAPREAAVEAAQHSTLDSAISAYVQHVGLPFLATSPKDEICASASQASNSTLGIHVKVQGMGCGSSPAQSSLALASSSLTLELPGRTVVIDAWLARQ